MSERRRKVALMQQRTRVLCEILATCLVLCAPDAGWPEGEGGTAREPQRIEVIVVRPSQLDAAEYDSPAPARVLDEQELRARVPSVLPDALRGGTAVHVQSTTTGQGSPFVRGLTGSSVLNLMDDMRINHAMYRSAPNPDLALVDPAVVERVGIVRGPGSVLYGSDAMGGVVRIETRRARFDSTGWDVRGALSTRLSSADLSGLGRAELELGRLGFGARGGFSYLAANDLRGGGGTGRQEPTDYSWFGGDLALDFEPADGHESRLDFQLVQQPESPRYDELVAGFGQDEPSSDVWQYEPLERLFVHARHTIERPLPGRVDAFELDAAYQRIRDGRRTRDFGSPIEVREQNASELLGFRARGLSLAAEKVALFWGAEAYFDEVSSSRHSRDPLTGDAEREAPRFPDGSRMDSQGVYLFAEYDWSESLRLSAGLRYSRFLLDIASTDATPSSRSSFDDVTGGLGLLWEFSPGWYGVANLNRGFRAPNVFDVGTLGPRPGNRFNLPSTGLEPEEIYTGDVGVKLVRGALRGEVFAFYSFYDDKIESVLTGEVTPDGRAIVRSENLNEAELLGLEASGAWDFRPGWMLFGELFWIWGEQRDAAGETQPADRIPPLQGSLGLRYEIADSVWVEPLLRFAASQDRLSDGDRSDPRIDPSGTDGWLTLNVRVGWRWSERLSGFVALENLTNASYREHGSGFQAAGTNLIIAVQREF